MLLLLVWKISKIPPEFKIMSNFIVMIDKDLPELDPLDCNTHLLETRCDDSIWNHQGDLRLRAPLRDYLD